MYHGEDLAKHAAQSAMIGGQRAYADEAQASSRLQRAGPSLPGLISHAAEMRMYAADRAGSLDALAGRALDIATRLTGSFPAPAPDRGAMNGEKSADPSSALDALQQTIGSIRHPLGTMDDGFHRLAAALDAIERALN